MPLTAIIIVLGLAFLALFVLKAPANRARSAFNQADSLLTQAESALARGELDLAISRFQQVLPLARTSGCDLFQAEAYFGMARVHEKRGNLPATRDALEKALSNRQAWEGEKPNFASLISNMLADVNRKSPR